MKLIITLIILFSFLSCSQNWESSNYNLASQAKNERDNFFYRYCLILGESVNCLIERDTLMGCRSAISAPSDYYIQYLTDAKRFISVKTFDYIRTNQGYGRPRNETESIKMLKQAGMARINGFTKYEWSKCREVAGL